MYKNYLCQIILSIANSVLIFMQKVLFWKYKSKFTNICIYRIANIGDTITAVPAMYKIREKYPDAKITLLTSPGEETALGAREVLEDISWLDEINVYYEKDINSIKKIFSFIKEKRRKKYDLFIQLPAENIKFRTAFRNILFAKLIGAGMAYGFYISMINLFVKEQAKYGNFPNDVLRLVRGLPWQNIQPIIFPIEISYEDKMLVESKLSKKLILNEINTLVISFSGKGEAQKWCSDRFSQIAKLWIEEKLGKVIIIGGKSEIDEANKIVDGFPENAAINLCGEFSIKQSMWLLKKTKALLTIDTGTAHMAGAMGIKCIELFSAYYLPGRWNAYGDNVTIIRKNLCCSPCMNKTCKFGKVALCMDAITVAEVWNLIKNI